MTTCTLHTNSPQSPWGGSSPVPPETHQTAVAAAKPTFQVRMPSEIPGMVTISRELFYATVGQLDVTPYPVGDWDMVFGYLSEWRLRDGRLVGKSHGEAPFSHVRYMVTQAFYDAQVAKEVTCG